MRKILMAQFFFLICLFVLTSANGQVTLSGPACVVPGSVYQYNIKGNWNSLSRVQVCITGGVISDSTRVGHCTPASGAPLATVLVLWKDTTYALITVTSSSGNNSLNVHITDPLRAGKIDSKTKTQTINSHSLPLPITCSPDSGGSCSPSYLNQWQQSSDGFGWVDIKGATHQNLAADSGLIQPTFYRRKVTEQISGTIAYSDVAFIDVQSASAGPRININSIIFQQYDIAYYLKKDIQIKTF